MVLSFLRYLKGYVELEIKGFFVEKFLNLCASENILIWDIKYLENKSVSLKMTVKGFKKVRAASRRTQTNVKIVKRKGIKFVINRNKHRKGLALGFILAFFVFMYLTSFVWTIQIEGNERLSNENILSILKEVGFEKGVFRYNIDEEKIKNDVLLKSDSLSWIWVEIKGTKAFVSVREKKEMPEMFDKNAASNVVASRNGLVTKVVAKTGISTVKEGDVVSKGDLLISGINESGDGKVKYTNATGQILARTWHEIEGETTLKETQFSKSFKKISKKTINLFGFDVLLYLDKKIPFEYYEKDVINKRLPFFPVSYTNAVFYELIKSETDITKEEAIKKKSVFLKKELEGELDESIKIIKKDVTHKEENGKIKVKVTYECIEDIAQKVLIDT